MTDHNRHPAGLTVFWLVVLFLTALVAVILCELLYGVH